MIRSQKGWLTPCALLVVSHVACVARVARVDRVTVPLHLNALLLLLLLPVMHV